MGRDKASEPSNQKAVCFSEIPLHHLKRLADARSEYGIALREDLSFPQRATPFCMQKLTFFEAVVTCGLQFLKFDSVQLIGLHYCSV
jgi:hypothetical protein